MAKSMENMFVAVAFNGGSLLNDMFNFRNQEETPGGYYR